MDDITVFPEVSIGDTGIISETFLSLNISTFKEACRYVHQMPYGYNSDREDLLILFKEKMGTCTTKHAVVGTLAVELGLPIRKTIGIYAMTEALVTGAAHILSEYGLPYLPMAHCFLSYETYRVDLTEGNNNGKNSSIEEFLFTQTVIPAIAEKDEYMLYRSVVEDLISSRKELNGTSLKQILHARQEGLDLLKARIREKAAKP